MMEESSDGVRDVWRGVDGSTGPGGVCGGDMDGVDESLKASKGTRQRNTRSRGHVLNTVLGLLPLSGMFMCNAIHLLRYISRHSPRGTSFSILSHTAEVVREHDMV
jgi:hypothetical protein